MHVDDKYNYFTLKVDSFKKNKQITKFISD